MSDTDNGLYSAAQLREFLEGNLSDKESRAHPHAGLVQDGETQDLLNLLATAYDGDVDESLPDRVEDTQTYQEVVANAATGTLTDAVADGNVAQQQHAVGMVDSTTEDGQKAKQRLASTLAREGAIVLVTGPPGSGKTATALDAARMAAQMENAHLLGNIRSWAALDEDDVVEDSEALGERMGAVDGRVIAALDEVAQVLRQTGSNQQAAEKFAKDLKLVRKYLPHRGDSYARQGSVVAVAHTLCGVGAEIRRVVDEVWNKPSASDPGRVEIYDVSTDGSTMDEVESFKGLTDTRESYDEHEGSRFSVPLEDDEDDQEDDVDVKDLKRRSAIEHAIRMVKPWDDDAGVRHKDAANAVDYSKGWVTNRVGEWKDGEWRDLVPPPGED